MGSGRTQRKIVLGTRGSELALAQADLVTEALRSAHPGLHVERRIVKTVGDKRPDLKLSEFSGGEVPLVDKGIFTKELEEALLRREIDIAVHSLKDVPTELGAGFSISAVLPRAPVEDVLLIRGASGHAPKERETGLELLAEGATVATSSVRRQAMLRWHRRDVEVADIRGNVPTRIRKLLESDRWDAILLARAGLVRLGMPVDGQAGMVFDGRRLGAAVLDPDVFLPAASQGCVAIETFDPSESLTGALGAISHAESFAAASAERHFLHLLHAGCQTPVGVYTRTAGGEMSMRVAVFAEGQGAAFQPKTASVKGEKDDPVTVAERAFASLSPGQKESGAA